MELNVSKCNDDKVVFSISGVSTPLVNAIRRVIMNSVQVFAVDKVTFYENTSAMFDEYISNRIGLVPIKTPDGYTEKDEILFSLDKSTPGDVLSKGMKSNDSKVVVANPDIPVILLEKGQQIRLEATAKLGTAKQHAKFQAGISAYEKTDDGFEMFVESFGQMSAKELLLKSVDIIEERLESAKEELKKSKD